MGKRLGPTDIGRSVGTRWLHRQGGTDIEIEIGESQWLDLAEDYYRAFSIRGLVTEYVSYAVGVDGIQAFELALRKIGTVLYTSAPGRAGELTWNGSEDLGFPKPGSVSDSLPSHSSPDYLDRLAGEVL